MKKCAVCNCDISHMSPLTKYCSECKIEVTKEVKRRSRIKLNPNAYKERVEHECEVCGSKHRVCKYKDGKRYCQTHYNKMYNGRPLFYAVKCLNKKIFHDDYIELISKHGQSILIDYEDFEKINDSTWCIDPRGYVVSNIDKVVRTIHRIIMDAKKGEVVDHIDGNRLDNRRKNLRLCSSHQNSMNSSKSSNKELPLGIDELPDGQFRARIMYKRVEYDLGRSFNLEEAVAMRKAGEEKFFKDFSPRLSKGDDSDRIK